MKGKQLSKMKAGMAVLALSMVLTACATDEEITQESQTLVIVEEGKQVQEEDAQKEKERKENGLEETQEEETLEEERREDEALPVTKETPMISHTVMDIPLDLQRYWYHDYSDPSVVKDTIYFPVSGVVIEEENDSEFEELVMELQIMSVNAEGTQTDFTVMQQQGSMGAHRDEYNYEYIFYTNPIVTAEEKVYAIRNHVYRKYEDIHDTDALAEPEKEKYYCYLDCWDLTGKPLFEISIDTCKGEEDPYLSCAQLCDLNNGSIAIIAVKEAMGFHVVDGNGTLSDFIPFITELSYRKGFDKIIEDGKGHYSILAYGEEWDFEHLFMAEIDFSSGKQIGEVHEITKAVADLSTEFYPGKKSDYFIQNGAEVYSYNLDDEVAYKVMEIKEPLAEEFVCKMVMMNENTFVGTGFYPGAERCTLSVFKIEE